MHSTHFYFRDTLHHIIIIIIIININNIKKI